MNLDVATLSFVTVFVSALLGALLVFAGLQNRSIRAPIWWGSAQIGCAIGLGLVAARGSVPDFLSIDIGNGLILLGYGLTWAGARVFGNRKVPLPVLAVAPLVWILACQVPLVAEHVNLRVGIASTMLAVLAAAAAAEFWRGRNEPLMSRGPVVCVLLAHAAMLLA